MAKKAARLFILNNKFIYECRVYIFMCIYIIAPMKYVSLCVIFYSSIHDKFDLVLAGFIINIF